MWTILMFCFSYYKLETFVLYVMYITPHLYVIKDFKILKQTLNF
jgi:hypothetical protein